MQARPRGAIPDLGRTLARELADAAHQICPYSKMTRNNIHVELSLA